MNNSTNNAVIDSNIAVQKQANNQEPASSRPHSGSHSPAIGQFGSQNPVSGDSPFDLSTYLAFPTANSNLGQSPNPVGEEVYKAFALGIKATQGDPNYKASQLQTTALSAQKRPVNKDSPQDGQPTQSEKEQTNTMNNQVMLDARGNGNPAQAAKASHIPAPSSQSTSSMLANPHDGSSGLSPYGLDPSAFQAEVRFQLPAFLNPTGTTATHPNGAEVWSGYGVHSAAMESFNNVPRQHFGVSEFGDNGGNTGFGMGSRFFGATGDNNGMNFGTAMDASSQDGKWQSTMQLISNQQSQNGMRLPTSGQNMQNDAGFAQVDGGGLAQWDNWSFNADAGKSSLSPGVFQYSADGSSNGFQTQQTASAPKDAKGEANGNAADTPRIQLTTGTNLTMPTSALFPNKSPLSASFPSSSAMTMSASKSHTGAPGNVADGAAGGIPHTADNIFASSSTSASAVAAQALANGPLGGLVQPGTFATQTPGGVNMPGLYSTTGFDMVSVLAKVAARRDPKSVLGPVDCSCSFVVVVCKRFFRRSTLCLLNQFTRTSANTTIRLYTLRLLSRR